jgi:cellulose synthase/poly-beta-1,6-N-acetylglucosamine synthase-like glycosyltransferase
MTARTRLSRKAAVVLVGLVWIGLSVHGLLLREQVWVSLIFFLSSVYGTVVMICGLLPRGPQTPPRSGYRPFVSVIVPARNEEHVIADTVRCLCALDYAGRDGRPHFEVIVVDHRSTDRTPQVLDALRRDLPFTVARPTPEDGMGKAVALNVGLAASRGEAICVFDADARVAPDFLERLVPYLDQPGVAGVQARKLVYDGPHSLLMRAQEDDYLVFQTVSQRSRHRCGGAVILTGNGFITRRDTLEAVGGWNEDALTEDIDLTIRYALRGWTVHYCEDVIVWEEAVATWRGLVHQRTRWSEGSLRCLFDHTAALLRAPVPWRKRLDFLVFLSGSLVLSTSMLTSYAYLIEDWTRTLIRHRLSVASAFPTAPREPLYTYYWIVLISTMAMSIAVERTHRPAELLRHSGRYVLFSMHQVVALPLALFRYGRSVFTGRLEWMKTEHRGVGLPPAPRHAAVLRFAPRDRAEPARTLRSAPQAVYRRGATLAPVGLPPAVGDPAPEGATPPP